ncbi:Gfo/Idh/MocA family protein [Temperatibacter marinus]
MGMVGGGQGAFIGEVHRLAAALDGKIDLVCGAFSRDMENTKATGALLNIDDNRLYASFDEMMTAEAAMPAEERMEFVAIVTPNHMHFPVAAAALKAGFAVLCDKPATLTLAEAEELEVIIDETHGLFGLTHTYLGYPMVSQARDMVAKGEIGAVRKVYVEYHQGWLAGEQDNKQAAWRTNPKTSGISGCMGDIGTHAHNLAEYITDSLVVELASELTAFVAGRQLDDDGAALLRFDNGSTGVLSASQVCVGEENGLSIRVYGDKGGMQWRQQEPNSLRVTRIDAPEQLYRAGTDHLTDAASRRCRTPAGHPEGYLEAFANLYIDFAAAIKAGEKKKATGVPGIKEGVRGMAFIEAIVDSSNNNSRWTKI